MVTVVEMHRVVEIDMLGVLLRVVDLLRLPVTEVVKVLGRDLG